MRIQFTLVNLFLLVFLGLTASAQNNHRNCGTMQHLHEMEAQDPGVVQRMQRIQRETEQWISQNPAASQRAGVVITIPVVFNIVYNTTAENVSDAQILSQLAILNQDFRKLNSDISLTPSAFTSLTADCEIEFCLAQRDPSGLATTGIRRQFTSTTSFSTNNAMKTSTSGLAPWSTSSYLNVWVCDLGSGLLGYAQFPGGSASTDGVVIDYQAFGNTGTAQAPFNKGRTATHEVGHWLGLRHIWGDATCGNDQISDTPPHQAANYGCPSFPKLSNCSGANSNGDMFMNYMDYTDDQCMYMFTPGQKAVMLGILNGSRSALLASQGCVPPSVSCGTPGGLSASNITDTTAILGWTAVSGANSYNVRYRIVGSTTWTNGTSQSTTLPVSGLTTGSTYEYQVQAACGTTLSAYSASSTFIPGATVSCGTPGGIGSSAITSSSATISWQAVSGATSYRVSYRVNGSTAAFTVVTTSNLSTSLSGLTASTTYQYNVQAVCGTVNGTASSNLTFTTSAAPTCSDPYESNNSRNAAKTVAVNTDLFARIGTSTDKDWFRFSTVSGSTNLRIVVDQLPADYDIRLYNSSGSQLAISQQSGTTSEVIVRNTTAATTYFIQIYGYNSAFNSTLCYRFRINTSGTAFRTYSEASQEGETEQVFKGGMEQTIQLFPNPASTQLQVNFQNESPASTLCAEIIDMLGKSVKSEIQAVETGFNQLRFDVSDLNNGIYFIRFQEGDLVVVRKFIVKH